MFSATAVSTAIEFKTITIAYSISALVISLVLLLYLFAAFFYFVKNCLKVLQCIEINCMFVPFSLKCCTMYIHMYFMVIISQIGRHKVFWVEYVIGYDPKAVFSIWNNCCNHKYFKNIGGEACIQLLTGIFCVHIFNVKY